jgi:RNA polymerase sigma-70 factor (ECF subfamily)
VNEVHGREEDSAEPALPHSPEHVRVLVANHRRFLAFLERRVGSREVAEDILQDAFVRSLSSASPPRDDDSVVAWFYRVLRNAMTDHWRRRAAEGRAVEHAATLAEGTVEGVDAELEAAVCECATLLLETLKPPFADAIRRVDLEGLSVKAFAEEAGITANSASVRLFRARRALREQVRTSCGTCAEHGCFDCSCSPSKS